MLKAIDNLLNRISMYKILLYSLSAWVVVALVLSFFNLLPFTPQALLYSTAVLLMVCWITNRAFTLVFKTHANVESVYITALILALLITPPASGEYIGVLSLLIWAGIWSMAAKFIMAYGRKHVFNPAAVGIVITALFLNQSATWWIGTMYMLPFVLIGGFLITRKVKRADLVISFLVVAIIGLLATTLGHSSLPTALRHILVDSPIFFFATVMLTEPLTTPPTRTRRIIYGALTGVFFLPFAHIASLYSTPELALCAGNLVSYILSPKFKYILTLTRKDKIASNTGEFIFTPDRPISFKPGQYMEWTLGDSHADSRGNRRYFTIASSPTEKEIHLGIKFDAKRSSSFKKDLAELEIGHTIMAGQLSGDFVMPKNPAKKLAFIAGGIGITPFRAMLAYLIDKGENRDIILFYSCQNVEDIAYNELLKVAQQKLSLKVVVTLTDLAHLPADWTGHRGFVDSAMIAKEAPDYAERTFFISGPPSLVNACRGALTNIGISGRNIHTDFFPGFI